MRGAHYSCHYPFSVVFGPSPRAWGSRDEGSQHLRDPRSIPTCVGLTISSPFCHAGTAVHPHVRGAHLRTGWKP
ncbi:hypothetical protein B005_4428 [Nocardiopsis alba ATCC BAA-2165]|uniref:Uncharacterized protein n=1 Tax=Nocardiopsis alba (strain ATCC BAA-2165 / BE74) TaxID=1205910 RepID=J7L815_NOCAA|nr:hypothetical protein B005_4428 [Nocardiopsis alba ATCC BAA-2165]